MVFDDTDLTPNRIEMARRAAAGPFIDLTSSNPTQQDLLFPPDVLEQAAQKYWSQRCYEPNPRGLEPTRQAIIDYYAQRRPALALTLDDIFITASTSEAYSLLFSLLTAPGDNILGPNVTYPLFEYLADLHHVELRTYELDPANNWVIDQASLLAAADQNTRAILLISPHNPTGAIISEPIAALNQLGIPLICDEVFAPFALAKSHVPALGGLHPDVPVFQLNGISKLLALPDLKLGWIALNQAAQGYAERLELINDTFLSCSTLIQTMLPDLLHAAPPFIDQMLERVRANIAYAREHLAQHPRLIWSEPDGGYYLFLQVRDEFDDEALVVRLIEQGVLVHPGFFFDWIDDCRIMLSALTEPHQWQAGIQKLAQILTI